MMRVLLDTNIVLDYLLNRPTRDYDPARIWQAHQQGEFEGYIAAITPINMHYILHEGKAYKKDTATTYDLIREALTAFQVCPLDGSVLKASLDLLFDDYEDAVQHASAEAVGLDAIVTQNTNDYANATIPVYSGAAFIALLP